MPNNEPTARRRRWPRLSHCGSVREMFGDLRRHLARADALVALSLLAVAAGLVTGGVIIAFRLLTESALVWAGVMPNAERFEALSWEWRLGLPIAGGLATGLLFQLAAVGARQVGPVHVMAQLAAHSGRMPWRNAVLQFFGGAISIASGHSVGREGPVIHVGAASASLLGQWMRLPNNSIRTLVACGVAGSIAASFNTPIAGVVFAMEVVMLEYTLLGFAPVILAAVTAASLSQIVYGAAPAFAVPNLQLVSLLELPWVVLLGLVIGCMAAAYVHGVCRVDERFRRLPLWLRTTAAGAFVGLCAMIAPEVMGLGYDTVQLALLGRIGLLALIVITVLKLAATIACGGLGLPGGLIGPMIVMGATAGSALGIIGQTLVPEASASPGFYATLGMVAMMGASLQAPLAALMAILELTGNPNTILPGMVAVVTAFLVVRVGFGKDPIFVAILRSRGIDYRFDPVAQSLERTGVGAVMSRRFAVVELGAGPQALEQALSGASDWLLVADGQRIVAVLPAAAVSDAPSSAPGEAPDEAPDEAPSGALPERFPPIATVALHATLREALAALDRARADVALVAGSAEPLRNQAYGVISRGQIESGVRYRF